ncbi:oligosaccharide repeat unit polymerase [Bacillus sp. FJAT-22090]|uniref:oligosaccharide repeat unit polymerase n=1 Tax=Bacillus sp. FJAT-22090 TaxID=1581038 RepID=UPI0012E2708C|nr:oligosaccharide repeat unit polymerase [Bacillus sp. FJAT-22090]
MIISGFILTIIITRFYTIKPQKIIISKLLLPIIITTFTILTYGSLFLLNGLPTFTALNVFEVYEVRSSVNYGKGIFEYLVGWQATVINLFCIGYGYWYRKRKILLLGIALQIVIYLYTGHKSFLFNIPVVIGVAYFVKKGALLRGALVSLNLVIAVGLFFYKIYENHLIATLFIRRTLFVPMKNHFLYYDFFSSNEKVYLSNSIFRFFIENPYPIPIPNLIGSIYYQNYDTWVNVGYLADAYMNFGFLGILLFSILLGIILKMFDTLSHEKGIELVIVTSFIPFFGLMSGALLTKLLTGGILLAFVLLILLVEKRGQKRLR